MSFLKPMFAPNRRSFLKYFMITPAAVSILPRYLPARTNQLAGKEVIVIGAGCAGLGAAQALVKAGADVTVVEAKSHIGGRISTDWSMGVPFEVGAGWIHGPEIRNPTRQLFDAVGAKYVITDDDNILVFDRNGDEISKDTLEEINQKWESSLAIVDRTLEKDDLRSLRKAIDDLTVDSIGNPGFDWAISAYTEFSKGAPIGDLSATLHDEDKNFDTQDVIVTTGYSGMLTPLAKGLDIKLATKVFGVTYVDNNISVTTKSGHFSADYVICSVPLGVLKSGSIKFDPVLPDTYQRTIDQIGFGSVTKIAFKFDNAFWDTDVQYFGIMTEPMGRWNYWLNYRTFSNENIILGISVGAYAPIADRMSDNELARDALEVLRGVWGDKVQLPAQMLRTSWSVDPMAFGAYSYPTPGLSAGQFDYLSRPIRNRLILAGEHTIFDYAGTTHGAYMSGLRAAQMLIEQNG